VRKKIQQGLKNKTIKKYCYENISVLEKHLQEFILAYNFAITFFCKAVK
jgi:hypothetical protein